MTDRSGEEETMAFFSAIATPIAQPKEEIKVSFLIAKEDGSWVEASTGSSEASGAEADVIRRSRLGAYYYPDHAPFVDASDHNGFF